jgi:hypothetical protein
MEIGDLLLDIVLELSLPVGVTQHRKPLLDLLWRQLLAQPTLVSRRNLAQRELLEQKLRNT